MKLGLCDKAARTRVQLTWRYDPHPANGVDISTSNDETLLAELMFLADSGFYFHLSRLINSPEEHQVLQVLFVLDFPDGVDHTVDLQALTKVLGLPNLVSYVKDLDEFVSMLHIRDSDCYKLSIYFEEVQRDPARSGRFHHDPPMWRAFAATRFLRFFSAASSQ